VTGNGLPGKDGEIFEEAGLDKHRLVVVVPDVVVMVVVVVLVEFEPGPLTVVVIV